MAYHATRRLECINRPKLYAVYVPIHLGGSTFQLRLPRSINLTSNHNHYPPERERRILLIEKPLHIRAKLTSTCVEKEVKSIQRSPLSVGHAP